MQGRRERYCLLSWSDVGVYKVRNPRDSEEPRLFEGQYVLAAAVLLLCWILILMKGLTHKSYLKNAAEDDLEITRCGYWLAVPLLKAISF